MWCAMQFDSLVASETNMDTSSSPDNLDSRKRPLENESENGVIKRSHYATGNWLNDNDNDSEKLKNERSSHVCDMRKI